MSPASLDATFAALADPTRRAILARLAGGEVSVMDLAQPFAMSQPAISKHLKVLEKAGLVSRGRDAQRRPVRVEEKPLAEATAWLENYQQATRPGSRPWTPCSPNCTHPNPRDRRTRPIHEQARDHHAKATANWSSPGRSTRRANWSSTAWASPTW
jgi:DNA-binding transcriptional ArsR family regulator